MTTRNGSTISYTSYDLPSVIGAGSNSSTLYYGAYRNRYKQVWVAAGFTDASLRWDGMLKQHSAT